MILVIEGCFYSPLPETTTTQLLSTSPSFATTITPSPSLTTGTTPVATTALAPITTAMNYCTEQQGMNQPQYIDSTQVTSNPPPQPTTQGSLNPTSTTPGLDYPSPTPNINITFIQPATLTLIYLPVDRSNQPSNVNAFTVVFYYPNGTTSKDYPSEKPPIGATTPITSTSTSTGSPLSTGIPPETTTTPSTNVVFPPSNISPRVNLPPNFNVPNGTVLSITVTSTTDETNAVGVRFFILFLGCNLTC